MRDERCGYVSDITGYPMKGRTCCWRPVYEDTDRCVWHADVDDKSVRDPAVEPDAGERLDGAVFRGLTLHGASWPADCVLVGADFSNADIREVNFGGADLRKSTFADSTATDATFTGANMEDAIVTDTDLRGADLTDVRLDQADLSSSRISADTEFGDQVVYEEELWNADGDEQWVRLESAIRMYRELEELSQKNTLYSQASRFYRKSKDARRRYNWATDSYGSALLAELSRWITGYGNMPMRVIYTSLAVILWFGLMYPLLGGVRQTNAEIVYGIAAVESVSGAHALTVLLKSIFFSTVTFTTLGYGNMHPVGNAAQYLAGLEALLGTILMSVLVGVLTRSTWLR